jgi:CubicO group peptidase (beta-lactamase class C family)
MKFTYCIVILIIYILFNQSIAQSSSNNLTMLDGETISMSQMETSISNLLKEGGIPGLSCAIINDSLLVYEKGFGLRSSDTTLLNNHNTIFNAASFSKTVFAWLVMLLSEDDIIDLHEPLQTYLDKPVAEYKGYSDLSGDERAGKITAGMVLSHSTGFPNWRFLTDDGKLQFMFGPASRFSYSGEGIQLLQMVIEKITGKGLQELAQIRIFEPFGMHHTSYVWKAKFDDNYSFPHDQYERSKKLNRRYEAEAAGSMQTTAGDYARFLQGLIQAGGKHRNSAEEMFSRQIRIKSKRMFGSDSWKDTDEFKEKNISWALGWGYFESKYGRAVFHTGHDFGAQNYTVLYLDKGIGVVLMGNSDNLESMARQLARITIGDTESPFDWLGYPYFDPNRDRTPPPEPVAIKLAPDKLLQFVGEYLFLEERHLIIKLKEGVLLMSEDKKDWTEMFPESESLFFIKGEEFKIEFKFNEEKRVNGFNLLVQGIKIAGEKIK